MNSEEEAYIKFLDENGNLEAKIPNDSDLLNAIVGYEHDPTTHNYNREERRRIIKYARKIRQKTNKGWKK